jgi:NAD(P)-dependent dehydrogenase (short-subunit alcohol dehydrogenase family)
MPTLPDHSSPQRHYWLTGASSGIGLEASVTLAKAGGDVVMVARDRTRGEAALAVEGQGHGPLSEGQLQAGFRCGLGG